jgi:branched-chain amino acid transport system permease protein
MTPYREASAIRLLAIIVLFVLGLLVPIAVTGSYERGVLNLALINVVLVLGFNFTLGYTGRISLGHIGFWAIGAYTTGLLTTDAGVSALPAMGAGVFLAVIVAYLLAKLTSRLHTHYLALATLGFGEIVRLILLNWTEVTHGVNGVIGIPSLSFAGLDFANDFQLYFVLYFVAILGAVVAWRFKTTRPGLESLAMKQGEVAAQCIGIPTEKIKVVTVIISAIYASIAGSLYAHSFRFLSPDVFSFSEMITVIAMLIVGGLGTISGPIFGAVALTFLPEIFRGVDRYWQLLYGIGVLFLVIRMPYGIAGLFSRLVAKVWRLKMGTPRLETGLSIEQEAAFDASVETAAQTRASDDRSGL